MGNFVLLALDNDGDDVAFVPLIAFHRDGIGMGSLVRIQVITADDNDFLAFPDVHCIELLGGGFEVGKLVFDNLGSFAVNERIGVAEIIGIQSR